MPSRIFLIYVVRAYLEAKSSAKK